MKIANWLRRLVGVPVKEVQASCANEKPSAPEWYYECPKCSHKHGHNELHAITVFPAEMSPVEFKLNCLGCGHISVWIDTGIAGHCPINESSKTHKQVVYGAEEEEHF